VNKIQPPTKANDDNFEKNLQLDKVSKNIIKKSVVAHGQKNIADYVEGKGKGLVILLWGVPGVGKTFTAESVAELAGRPLFSVGVSDIGLEGPKVEVNLQKVFDLAGLWKAVLLLWVLWPHSFQSLANEGFQRRG
jgi:AAA+ superfamily predicted ATPase